MGDILGQNSIASLDLSYNNLYTLTEAQLQSLSGAIQKAAHLKSLSLANNRLNSLDSNQWYAFCHAILKFDLDSLYLDSNNLGHLKLTKDQLKALSEVLQQAKTNMLGLSDNNLHLLTAEQWYRLSQAFEGTNLSSLDLSKNQLSQMSSEQLSALGMTLHKAGVTKLYLNCNDLSNLSEAQWLDLTEALQASSVYSLSLKLNNLYSLTDEQWRDFCNTICNTKIKSIDLRDNGLKSIGVDRWLIFAQAVGGDAQYRQTLAYALHALAQKDQLDSGTVNKLVSSPKNALRIAIKKGVAENANEGTQAYYQMTDVSKTIAELYQMDPAFQQLPEDTQAHIVTQAGTHSIYNNRYLHKEDSKLTQYEAASFARDQLKHDKKKRAQFLGNKKAPGLTRG